MTSSPGPMPAANTAAWSAAVPELTATAWAAPTAAATARSNSATRGPVVSRPPRSTASAACTSSSSIACHPYGRNAGRTGRPPWSASGSVTAELLHLVGREPHVVGIARVAEARRGPLAAFPALEAPRRVDGLDDEHPVELQRLAALVLRNEDLVELLAGADPDVLDQAPGRNRLDQIHDPHARDLGDEDLAAPHLLRAADGELDALLEPDPEARHGPVGHGHAPRGALGREERDHAAAAADHIAVAHHGEGGASRVTVHVPLHEELLRAELGGAVEIEGATGLVGTHADYPLDPLVDGGVDHVLGAEHVGLDGLERVVLAGGDLLQRRRVEHDVHAVHGAQEPLAVAHVADEEAQRRIAEARHHLRLLQLVAAEDAQPPRPVPGEHDLHELVAEGSGAARDEDGRLPPGHGSFRGDRHDPLAATSRPAGARSGDGGGTCPSAGRGSAHRERSP